MGNRWGDWGGKWNGGGGQFTSNLGSEWTGVAPHAKEGFQVSKRDLGTGEGLPGKGGLVKGFMHVPSYCQPCIYILYYCVHTANKRVVFRLEINHVCEKQDTCV
jgi:hypothetical protein